MMAQANMSRDEAFLASETDPQTRNDVARSVVFECRRVNLRRLAEASRDNNVDLINALKAQQDIYDKELNEISKGNKKTVEHALTHHVKFLKAIKQKNQFLSQPTLKDGPG